MILERSEIEDVAVYNVDTIHQSVIDRYTGSTKSCRPEKKKSDIPTHTTHHWHLTQGTALPLRKPPWQMMTTTHPVAALS